MGDFVFQAGKATLRVYGHHPIHLRIGCPPVQSNRWREFRSRRLDAAVGLEAEIRSHFKQGRPEVIESFGAEQIDFL